MYKKSQPHCSHWLDVKVWVVCVFLLEQCRYFIMELWDTHYTALLPFARHPWQPGRPLCSQKCAFNWVTSNQAVKYSSGVNKTGQQGTRTTSCCHQYSTALSLRCWPTQICLVLMSKITGLGDFLDVCVIGYDEPFLRLQLGEEACLWCADITVAGRSHKQRLNTY